MAAAHAGDFPADRGPMAAIGLAKRLPVPRYRSRLHQNPHVRCPCRQLKRQAAAHMLTVRLPFPYGMPE